MSRCKICGLDSVICCCSFNSEEEEFKNELKSLYYEKAGDFATKVGLANFIWKDFFSTKYSEDKAWKEKQSSITNMGNRFSAKYDPIIEEKNREIERQSQLIKKLQGMVIPLDPINDSVATKELLGCNSCGSKTGCYCK